ncbi:MAG TPA: hypothetical protein VN654_04340 [Vicinamibacterales bacterium]|nr:hypothetical protein [Vicinamibacterales bacterium]
MMPRLLASLTAAALMLIVPADRAAAQANAPRTAGGCPLDPVKFHACALPKTKTFDPPRTEDGRPDMQGYWDRAFTSQDVEEHGADGLNVQPGPSLVLDTPDHKIPYQPWALEFRKGIADRFISPLASCFPPGVPRHAIAPAAHRIVQMPGYVVYMLEYSHSYRVIPTGGEAHVGGTLKFFQGDSRGRWEGNTLVVDVTNNNGLTWLDNAGNFASEALHVVERYTLIDRDTIHYEARMEDPKVYTRPWTMVSALTRNRDRNFEIWEQACHEGNQSVKDQLSLGLKPYTGVP